MRRAEPCARFGTFRAYPIDAVVRISHGCRGFERRVEKQIRSGDAIDERGAHWMRIARHERGPSGHS